MSWLLLALLGQVFWAAGNLFDKFLLSKFHSDNDGTATGPLILFSALAGAALAPVFWFMADAPWSLPPFAILGLLFNGALVIGWISFYLHALERHDASVVVPLFQFIPVFGYLLGVIFLQEFLSLPKILFGVLVVCGALLLTIEFNGIKLVRFAMLALTLMLTAAFLEALSNVVFKYFAVEVGTWTALLWTYLGMALTGVALALVHKPYRIQFVGLIQRKAKSVLGLNTVNEFFDVTGNVFFLFALTLAPVAIVQTSLAFQPLFVLIGALALGSLVPQYFAERHTRYGLVQKSVAVMLIVIGSYFLY